MKINYKGYEIEGTVEEIKKLIKNDYVEIRRGNISKRIFSEEHKRKISNALRKTWAEKKKYRNRK